MPGPGEGDGECARRIPHVEDLIIRFEGEQVEEPALVVAGRVSRERRGPLVPIGLRVSVDCAVLCRHEGPFTAPLLHAFALLMYV